MAAYGCNHHRTEAPARLAGELSALEQERFDGHQRTCSGCHALYDSLARALAAARAEPEPLSAADKDREYAALMDRLRADGNRAAEPVRPRRWAWAVAGAGAMAAAAALLLALSAGHDAPVPQEPPLVSASPSPRLDVRAVTGTEWNLEETGRDQTLVLRRGTVYVRLAPLHEGESFEVRAPDLRVRVIGTIFSVRSEPGRPTEVAVMRGAVVVERVRHGAMTLVAGEASAGPDAQKAAARDDYARVRDWLAEPSVAASPPPAAPLPSPPAPAQGRVRAPAKIPSLSYAEAERALTERGPAAAAELLERLIAERPDGADADTARLELGTLYVGPLSRPDDARRHLATFLGRNPSGPGAEAARVLLCPIDPQHGQCTAQPRTR